MFGFLLSSQDANPSLLVQPDPAKSAQDRSNVYSQLLGLENVVFNDFIKDDFIPALKVMVKSRQVLHPFLTL